MSDYYNLPSVKSIYFTGSNMIYKMRDNEPIFNCPMHLNDVDNAWIDSLIKEDKKKIEKDLKKFKKI